MELQKTLVSIERQLWTNDAAVYADNLMENAVLVFAETGAITRDVAVEAIKHENAEGRRWAEVKFEDVRTSELAVDTVLLFYRVTARWAHEASTISAYASSIYVKQSDRWKLAFHQQTAIPTVD